MSFQHVTIFLANGATYRFHKVTGYNEGIKNVYFQYESASDGKINSAHVLLNSSVVMIARAS